MPRKSIIKPDDVFDFTGVSEVSGWHRLVEDFPWFRCKDCFEIDAYSEFIPPPFVGLKPYGKHDQNLFSDNDPFGWNISELEEEYELKPGIEHAGMRIMNEIIKLGKGKTSDFISGHSGENLEGNPYWPEDIARKAGKLRHERFLTLLPLMLSRTKDDKGRIIWTLFGNSTSDPEEIFWKGFYRDPENEIPAGDSVNFFSGLINKVYGERLSDAKSLYKAGFRISASHPDSLPEWTRTFFLDENEPVRNLKYLFTFRPFGNLPDYLRRQYLTGKIFIIPFPGSLVFWGMPGYLKLRKELAEAGQIPVLNLLERNTGTENMKITQSGWLHETRKDDTEVVNENLVLNSYRHTHRWERVYRFQDELSESAQEKKLVKALFSTDPDDMGLYDKPAARNSHLWTSSFDLLLNGPRAGRDEINRAEMIIKEGGLFGVRFFYPPMRVGHYRVYLHRPLVAYLPAHKKKPVVIDSGLKGCMTGYHTDDTELSSPVYMWPRMLRRDMYLSAINDFTSKRNNYPRQTSLNILSLLESRNVKGQRHMPVSFAFSLLDTQRNNFEKWLDDLAFYSRKRQKATIMRRFIMKSTAPEKEIIFPGPLTFQETAGRKFEKSWWNDIRTLAHGEFKYKDNADIMHDESTLSRVQQHHRDLDKLAEFLLNRHKASISEAGMNGKAIAGELPFKWKTTYDFPFYGGWSGNRENHDHERNLLVMIPGKNRSQAVIFADHYDTAYMEDIYEKSKGGTGARLSSNGADDNYSATSALLQASPVFLKLSAKGMLKRDIWLLHLTGEEFPGDALGARNFCQSMIEHELFLHTGKGKDIDLSKTEITGSFIMDMIGHNNDDQPDIFQISPGAGEESLRLAYQAHLANILWNEGTLLWNRSPERRDKSRGKRSESSSIPETARHLPLRGQVRTRYNPFSMLFNTDAQIFSDTGIPVVLFMENFDYNRNGYHDSKDTIENIDLDYGAALAAIAIETVARVATLP